MKAKHRHEESVELEMTPMIDVTFLLLVFFLCTIRFKTLEGKLAAYLPKDAGGGAGVSLERIAVCVEVVREGTRLAPRGDAPWSGQGRFRLGADRLLSYRVGPLETADLALVEARLAHLHALDPERPVALLPGERTVYADVVALLDAARAAGFDAVSIEGLREP